MSSLFFWNNWIKSYRYLWYALAVLFTFSLGFLWYSSIKGADNVIAWQTMQEQKVIETNVHTFRLGPFTLNVPGESYAILEYLNGSQVQPNVFASYLYLALTFIALTVIIAVITTLPRTWFYVATGILILALVTLRLEVLGLFGLYNKITPAVAIALYAIPAFYFNRFSPTSSFLLRLATFIIVTIILGLLIGFFSHEPLPFYHLVITSFAMTLIFALVFIIMVAHEIFAGFVYISTQGTSKSLQHMALLSTIYLVNVILTLLHELGMIKFDFLYINLFLLLTISAILAIWGFRQRERLYQEIIPFNPYGSFIFLSVGIIAFAAIAHQLANANDPVVLVLRHAIIFSHAAYGVIFLLYLLSNFGQMFSDNQPVHKVLYDPHRMPYFTYRLAGFVAMLAIVFYAGWREYVFNSFSAFYNTAGDFYSLQHNDLYAKSFYQKASSQGFHNHRSNYCLGMMDAAALSFEAAHAELAAANSRRPTEFSLTNSGNIYIREGEINTAVEEYKQSLKKMESSGPIMNNLGVAFTKLKNSDSALVYLSKAQKNPLTKTTAETNFFALAALEMIPINPDSIYKTFNNPAPSTLSNVYALASALNVKVNIDVDPLRERQLNLYTATLLNNYILHNAKSLDTAFTSKAYKIASDSVNAKFSEALKASLAFAYYHQGNIGKALEILAEQIYLSQSYQGKFNYIMGLWSLEQNSPELAATFFSFADTQRFKDAPFYQAISLTEARKTTDALHAWDSVMLKGDKDQKAIAANIKRILTLPIADAYSLPDGEKYQFCRYRFKHSDSLAFNRIVSSLENDNYRAQALLDYSKLFFENGDIISSIRYYQKIAGLKLSDKKLFDDVRYFELRLLANRGDLRGLSNQINKGIEFTADRFLEKVYYTALLNEMSGDTVNAKKNYAILARYNPYFEDGVIAAFNYHKKNSPRGFDAYNILAEAVQVNATSLPLLRAYHDEALRVGLEEYAASTAYKIRTLEMENR